MATSSFNTVFKMPKKALREIAKNIDKPVVRFKLSEKDKESLATSGEIPEMVGQQQELSLEQLGSWLGYADDSIIEQVLARFLCSRNKEVEEFLHYSAIAFEKSSSARTYLLATENKDIAGYFTLSIGFADISKSVDLSEEDKQKLKMSKCPDHRIPCFLIGQLGRNDSFSHDELPGNQILEIALAVLVEVKDQIGGKFVIVECEDHLVSMYQSEQFGFRLFNTSSKKRTYNQLFRLL